MTDEILTDAQTNNQIFVQNNAFSKRAYNEDKKSIRDSPENLTTNLLDTRQ